MSEGDRGGDGFEEQLRALARQLSQSVERAAGQLDFDEIADRIATGGERVRELTELAGRWLTDQGQDAKARAAARAEEAARLAGPHPRDVPTEEQGLALSALDSGRWKVEPGTNELSSEGEGPSPGERVGLVGELRARDWITANGELTLLGRAALKRWEESAAPG